MAGQRILKILNCNKFFLPNFFSPIILFKQAALIRLLYNWNWLGMKKPHRWKRGKRAERVEREIREEEEATKLRYSVFAICHWCTLLLLVATVAGGVAAVVGAATAERCYEMPYCCCRYLLLPRLYSVLLKSKTKQMTFKFLIVFPCWYAFSFLVHGLLLVGNLQRIPN